jgi:hypothetical protein
MAKRVDYTRAQDLRNVWQTASKEALPDRLTASGIARMPKALCIVGMVVAAMLAILFGLDLALGVPFGGKSMVMSIGFLVCAILLGYLSWTTFREQL